MSRPGGHFFEEFLIETKGAKTTGNLPAGTNNYPAPSLGPIGEKNWQIKTDVARLGYNEHFFMEFLIEMNGAKTKGNLPVGPNNYPAPSLGPISEKKWRI